MFGKARSDAASTGHATAAGDAMAAGGASSAGHASSTSVLALGVASAPDDTSSAGKTPKVKASTQVLGSGSITILFRLMT